MTGLLFRVAERPVPEAGKISFPILVDNEMEIQTFDINDGGEDA